MGTVLFGAGLEFQDGFDHFWYAEGRCGNWDSVQVLGEVKTHGPGTRWDNTHIFIYVHIYIYMYIHTHLNHLNNCTIH